MPDPTQTPIPAHRLAAALDTVLITTPGHHFHLGLAQMAWSDLKEARGQQVNFARLAPSHLIEAAPQADSGLVGQLDAACARTSLVVREIRAARQRPQADMGGAA